MNTEKQIKELISDNAKMKNALINIKHFAPYALFGAWRLTVYNMANTGLKK